jgi:hypothetical protein
MLIECAPQMFESLANQMRQDPSIDFINRKSSQMIKILAELFFMELKIVSMHLILNIFIFFMN